MTDIELVVKLPEKTYKDIKLLADYGYKSMYHGLVEAISNGTPLPKEHGRLYDENELKKEAIRYEWSRNMYDKLDYTLSYMKPIIEADKEQE